jgi:uncharacterized protein (DUF2252 family)
VGKNAARQKVPRSAFGDWKPPEHRDPIGLLVAQEKGRIAGLIPLRHERMLASPFAFYRGTALIMASDLSTMPVTGIRVQACGDAHIANFGIFGTPERNLVFDVNDFDETLPGPWEWDVLRMAASIALAARARNFSDAGSLAVLESLRTYREAMGHFASISPLDVWYERVDLEAAGERGRIARRSATPGAVARARQQTGENLLPKLTTDTPPRFVDQKPTFERIDLDGQTAGDARAVVKGYRETLLPHVRVLLERFTLHDLALKVVGVGSVGTLCLAALFLTEHGDPLLLQLKEAQASALEPYVGSSRYANHGQRVVAGQRLMQASSDIFLGWTAVDGKDFYVRQLRDMKASPDLTAMTAARLVRYSRLCAWTLARAHARSGDSQAIADYLGARDSFDKSVSRFARTYADVAESDYRLFSQTMKEKKP